jgi:hypothetical protein
MNVISRCYFAGLALACATTAVGAEEIVIQRCGASVALDYFQRGAEAEAEMSVDTLDCAAASGSFVVEVSIRADSADGPEKLVFDESWSREDKKPVIMKRKYAIGDAVQLLRIRIRKVACSCDEETRID